jgi:DNA-binding XRE family transcriptional regulator
MTKVELARRAGVTERTIRNLEGGVHEPSMATAMKIARALNVPLQALVEPVST